MHRVLAGHPDSHYQECPFEKIIEDIAQAFDLESNIYLVVIDNKFNVLRCRASRNDGIAQRTSKSGGIGLVHERAPWDTVAHELGHAFGLKHDFSDSTSIMSYGDRRTTLSDCYATWLGVHPAFNKKVSTNDGAVILAVRPVEYEHPTHAVLRIACRVPAEVYQSHLTVQTMEPHDAAGQYELNECVQFEPGQTEGVIRFDFTGTVPSNPDAEFLDVIKNSVQVSVLDSDGNYNITQFRIPPPAQ